MKIILSQFNPTVGDIDGNVLRIKEIVRKNALSVDIIVFPEMCVTGYPPQDLLFYNDFIHKAIDATLEIAQAAINVVVIVGNIRIDSEGLLYNSGLVLQNQSIIGYQDKSLLPSYDIFDEKRYFNHAMVIEPVKVNINEKKISIGVQICEDLWDQEYPVKVSEELHGKGANIIINISASPFHLNKIKERIDVIKYQVSKISIPFFYCNLIGGQDEIIFDGQSLGFNSVGKIIAMGKAFEEDLVLINTNNMVASEFSISSKESQLYCALKLGVRDYFKKTGHNLAVIGLSGGIDSALTATIAADALGSKNVIGVSLPSKYSSDHSIEDAKLLANNLDIQYKELSISSLNASILETLDPFFANTEENIAEENIQARIRGLLLMAISNKKNALVLNTGNKTESAIGYCTLYGDMCGALAVISDLNKDEVYSISKWFNEKCGRIVIPINTIEKEPSAELRENQVDPFNYKIVSPLIDNIITSNKSPIELSQMGFDNTLSRSMINKVRKSEYKRRQSPPGIRVSRKAFGHGRRLPIVNKYRD